MKSLKLILSCLILSAGIFFTTNVNSQCAVCKTNVENSLKSGGKKTGLGINAGITALLVMPYVMVGLIGVLWYTNGRRKSRKEGPGINRQK